MRRIVLVCISLCLFLCGYSQQKPTSIYQVGISAYENLQAIGNLTPYSQGGVGFDTELVFRSTMGKKFNLQDYEKKHPVFQYDDHTSDQLP